MSQTINLHDDPKFAGVLADLDSIETKLLENGKLVELTGTVASSVAIEFDMYGEGIDAEPSILIKVTTPDDLYVDADESVLEDFEDFVIFELEEASIEWTQEVKDALGDDRLVILLINDEEV
ncbi:MAG: hypothetical protein HGB02_06210 [Chlorobiaceae bacterium]|nr:hypothetical protein [Chlorobiaceae bacterium]